MRKDILICRCLEFFALQKIGMTIKGLSYSCLTRVFMDPRNKSEDDKRECAAVDDERVCVSEDDCYKKMSPSMTIMMLILVSSLTMTNMAHAECTPAPDCASIGYTETSCETTSLKCPFDISKLKCLPCDSSYKYDCFGDNITGGVGDTCNNKYASCSCITGATFNNGNCICDTSCKTIGNIYYADKSCSSCVDSTKTAVGIVAYCSSVKCFIVSLDEVSMPWSVDQTDADGNVIISGNGVISGLFDTQDLAREDFSGYENTQNIVNYFGEEATDIAAVYCYNYAPNGLEDSKGKWYLPALGEIYYGYWGNRGQINSTLSILGLSSIGWSCHWSSTEQWTSTAWNILVSSGGSACSGYRNSNNIVRCVKAI